MLLLKCVDYGSAVLINEDQLIKVDWEYKKQQKKVNINAYYKGDAYWDAHVKVASYKYYDGIFHDTDKFIMKAYKKMKVGI